jgi:hypothetical protein
MTVDPSDSAKTPGFAFTSEDMAEVTGLINKRPDQLLQIPDVCSMLSISRLSRVNSDGVSTAAAVSDGVIENALEHNLDALRNVEELDRPWRLINPLRSNNYFILHHKTMKVLTVGPRTEAEILNLIGSGFQPENIRGLDLLSYSPFVDVGDMHAMPYDDNIFDVVILGWVLGYSRDNATVAAEVLRVARPGAFVLIGCQYNPRSNDELNRTLDIKKEPTRYQHTDDMVRLFDGHIRSILFRHDVHPTMRHRNGDLIVIFDLKA